VAVSFREWGSKDHARFIPVLIERDGKKCHYCKKEVYLAAEIRKQAYSKRDRDLIKAQRRKRATIDHRYPRSKGGDPFDPKNMVIACVTCNQKKDDRTEISFRKAKVNGRKKR
jgi:5-methylcytosine-specific restriction endonuclease McrA